MRSSFFYFVTAALMFGANATPTPQVPDTSAAPASCSSFSLPGRRDGYTKRTFVDFSSAKSSSQTAEQFLNSHGFSVSNYPISAGPVPREFTPNNLILGDGALQMKVNAYTGTGNIVGAEFLTNDRFKFASVRTVQKSSRTPGVVEGNFFYQSDNQEIDWEILTSTIDQSSTCVPKGVWATNQATVPGAGSTNQVIQPPFDPRDDFHEYRIDWTPDATTFFLDGKNVAKLTTNVPSEAGPWIWNVWSNGDPCWSNGPPTADSITQIRSIEMFTGYVAEVASDACPI